MDKGVEYIKNIDKVALNKLFQDYLVKYTQMNSPLMIHSVTVVEEYLQKWIKKIIPIFDKEQPSNSDFELFLEIKTNIAFTQHRTIAITLTIADNYLSILSIHV